MLGPKLNKIFKINVPLEVWGTLMIYISWVIFASLILSAIIKNDDGLFAQIAIPIIFGIIHLIITSFLIYNICFVHRFEIDKKWKLIFGVLIVIPFVLIFSLIPVFKSIFYN